MTGSEIRRRFIDFFIQKQHLFIAAAPVVPHEDPTILFTNAGMNQFKDIFLGTNPKKLRRAVNSQPCIRVSGKHNDLEDVGHDGTHQTLFEMLGNWSFGDYYKAEAIQWAWEFMTEVCHIPVDKLYVTVYETDDEAEYLWKTKTSVRHDHILRFGKKDNFWEMGDVGPCGPCSEIHVDLGEGDGTALSKDPIKGVNGQEFRFIEFWNLVFIQFNREADGSLTDLTHKHVDTGMGLERLVTYMQGVRSNYETDLIRPLIDWVALESRHPYFADERGVSHRVIADHIRTLVFSIADNVMPSNDGRGYVMRRLLRRALRYAAQIGFKEPVLFRLVSKVVDMMSDFYPHLKARESHIIRVIKAEEEGFLRTLSSGVTRFQELISVLRSSGAVQISGEDAFKLYDTYGFPLDLTQLMAREIGVTVDVAGFNTALDVQKSRSRDARKEVVYTTADTGNAVDLNALAQAMPDLFHSPHQTVARGGEARVLTGYRDKLKMARHHTATHLLHDALRDVLGDHVQQAGSLVDTDRLRFDFAHYQSMTPEQVAEVERKVNAFIRQDIPLMIEEMSLDAAKAKGAMALFGEKYDADCVRVVSIGTQSIELCGGTHVSHTGMIERFKIIQETAISSGTRRIEALAGKEVIEAYLDDKRKQFNTKMASRFTRLSALASKVKGPLSVEADDILCRKVADTDFDQHEEEVVKLIKKLEKQVNAQQSSQLAEVAEKALKGAMPISGGSVVAASFDLDMAALKTLSEEICVKAPHAIAMLGSLTENAGFVVKKGGQVSSDISSLTLLNDLIKIAGGRGGGRADFAQAGSAKKELVDTALTQVKTALL